MRDSEEYSFVGNGREEMPEKGFLKSSSSSEEEEEEEEEEVIIRDEYTHPKDDDHHDDDDGLPLFANRKNRELNQDVKGLESKLEKSNLTFAENSERVQIMKEHFKNVEQEIRYTEQLLEAKSKELKTETHLQQLAKREIGRVRSDIENLKLEKDELASKLSQVKNEIFKGNEKIDKLKLSLDYDQEELEQWALAAKQQDDDDLAYQRYTKADEGKIKELNKQIEKLTTEKHEKESALREEITETQSKQIELDKTAEEFRTLHRERRQLVKQWHDTINNIQKRDQEIEQTGVEFSKIKTAVAERKKLLESEKSRIEMMEQDNVEAENQIESSNRILEKQREELARGKEQNQTLKSEVDLLKSEVAKANHEAEKKKLGTIEQKKSIEELKTKIEAARERFREAKTLREKRKQEMGTSDEKARDAENYLKQQEIAVKEMDKQLAAIKEKIFKQSQQLFQARQEEASLIAQISGTQASSKNLSAQLHKLDEQSLHQQELVYTAQFRIQQLERKVSRAKGERSDEEKRILNQKIEICQEEHNKAKEQHTMLQAQLKKLENESRACKRTDIMVRKQRAELEDSIAELTLECSSAETLLDKTMKDKEQQLVGRDIKKLQVKRLRDQLKATSDDVFKLENSKFQLEMSMEERKKEIQAHQDTQKARLKVAEEERHKIAMESKERSMRVDKLKLKYATVCKNGGVGDDGKERSQAYFVIAAAQKREELQREGDELDSKIRKCDREIRALSNTLNHLNVRNSEFRAGFHKANPDSKGYKEYLRLEKEYKSASDMLFRKKKELQRLDTDLQEDNRRVAQIQEQTKQLQEHAINLENANNKIMTEVKEQGEIAERYEDERIRESREHRKALNLPEDEETKVEAHFKVIANKETRDNILHTLKELAFEFPEMEEILNENTQRYGLATPQQPPSTPAYNY